jgi:hypothetical protein
MDEWRFQSSHESAYLAGSKCVSGHTILRNGEYVAFVIDRALVGLTIKCICENSHSNSLDKTGIAPRECYLCLNLFQNHLSSTYSQNPRMIHLLFDASVSEFPGLHFGLHFIHEFLTGSHIFLAWTFTMAVSSFVKSVMTICLVNHNPHCAQSNWWVRWL